MSALYGLIRLDGPAVTSQELGAMARPMASWGPDGGGTWCEGGAALGVLVAHRTPESVHEQGPRAVAGGRVIVAAAGRLDNRDELCAELGVALSERRRTPDGQLIRSAYARWGEGAVRRLLGDWAFAAYDAVQRRLVLARDHYGQTGLYYYYDGQTLAFASRINSLLALPGVPVRLNELRLAQHLVPWPVDGAATLYEGVRFLPPAHLLTLAGTTLRTREYWRPQDAPEVRFGSDAEYVERFVELFSSAVRARIRTTGAVASSLSGGLDSAAVTALTARWLQRDGGRLTAFTSVPAYPEIADAMPGALVDEWPGAQLVASAYDVIDHVAICGRDFSPLRAIDRSLEIHDEPVWGVMNMPWILSILEDSRRRGAGVLLTGQMGNGGVSWAGQEGVTLRRLASRDMRGAVEALLDRRRSPGMSWPLAVRRELAGPLRRRVCGALERRRRAVGPLIKPAFARRLDLERRMSEDGFDPTFVRATEEERRLAILLPGVTSIGAIHQALGAAHGLDVCDPTGDVRLLEFCFGVPPDQFARGDHDRWLMRRGLEGLVPSEVRWNRRRGVQGADIAYRLRADADAVTAAIEGMEASSVSRAYLDVAGLRERWNVVRGRPGPAAIRPANELTRGLSFGHFLSRFD